MGFFITIKLPVKNWHISKSKYLYKHPTKWHYFLAVEKKRLSAVESWIIYYWRTIARLFKRVFLFVIFTHLKNIGFSFNLIILSMVERNKPILSGCFPVETVFHLVTFYRPTVESLTVVLRKLLLDTAKWFINFFV